LPLAAADDAGNFHQTAGDDINAVARRAFLKNLLPGGKLFFLGDEPQALQIVAAKTVKQGNGFQINHAGTLWEKKAG